MTDFLQKTGDIRDILRMADGVLVSDVSYSGARGHRTQTMIHDTDTSVTAIVPSTVCQRIEAAVIYLSILQIIFHFQSRHFATRCCGLRQKVQGLKWNKCLLVAGLHNIKHHTPTPRCDWLWVCINLHIYTDTSSVSAFVGFLSCLVLLKINNVHECEWHSEIPNAWDTSARDTRVFNMGCKISQIIPEMLSLYLIKYFFPPFDSPRW